MKNWVHRSEIHVLHTTKFEWDSIVSQIQSGAFNLMKNVYKISVLQPQSWYRTMINRVKKIFIYELTVSGGWNDIIVQYLYIYHCRMYASFEGNKAPISAHHIGLLNSDRMCTIVSWVS